MQTVVYNFEIKDADKENDKLKDSSKANYEASFGKLIMDFIKEGKTVKLSDFTTREADVNFKEKVEAVDEETGETEVLEKIVKKPCYVCSIKMHLLKEKINGKNKCTAARGKNIIETANDKLGVSDSDKGEIGG